MDEFIHIFLKRIFCAFVISTIFCICANAFTIMLDPGHGGRSDGCTCRYRGKIIREKDLNLKIAAYLKKELEKYMTQNGEKIKVFLTHSGQTLSIDERVYAAKSKKADVLISLHNNSHGNSRIQKGGCMVLATNSNFNNLYGKEETLAQSILKELNKAGVRTASFGKSSSSLRKNAKKEQACKREYSESLPMTAEPIKTATRQTGTA